jgi:hypothetical protein
MPSDKRQSRLLASLALIAVICAVLLPCKSDAADDNSLWSVYEQALKGAKYVDLTHTITPNIPVRAGFADSTFAPAKAGADIEGFAKSGEVYTYAKHGFEARSLTRRPIGRRSILQSTSYLRPMRCGRSWSSPSSSG